MNNVKSLCELSGAEIKTRFPGTYCRGVAHDIINYLCGKQEKFETKPSRYPAHVIDKTQEFKNLKNLTHTLILFEMGSDYHTFVVEKLIEDNNTVRFIIYQAWFPNFDLCWWLDKDQLSQSQTSEEVYKKLRDDFGKGKKLNQEELLSFIDKIYEMSNSSFCKPANIGIAGTYTPLYVVDKIARSNDKEQFPPIAGQETQPQSPSKIYEDKHKSAETPPTKQPGYSYMFLLYSIAAFGVLTLVGCLLSKLCYSSLPNTLNNSSIDMKNLEKVKLDSPQVFQNIR